VEAAATVEIDGQYRALREEAGFCERAGRAALLVRGSEAADYLQGQLTNDIEALEAGEGCYSALLDRKGRMQGDMRVLRLTAEEIWMDMEAVAVPAAKRHLAMYKVGRDVEIEESNDAVVSVIGPAAPSVTGAPPLGAEHAHRDLQVGGVRCRVVATDLGVDLIVASSALEALTGTLIGAGVAQVGAQAAEIVRVESGRPRFGLEMTTETIPQEAGINERAVSFEKGCYIGQETVARLHYKGKPNRHLRGLRLEAVATTGESITLGKREVGKVGTAVLSPALGQIALAIVRREAEPGTAVVVGEAVPATVVELPF
jgi:folate-binding protein YgfZ